MNKLKETSEKFPQTEIWNDSCSCSELAYCIENGGVGATTNPVIVLNVLKKEIKDWDARIKMVIQENPTATEDEIVWLVIKLLGAKASELLYPRFKETNGKQGRISFQTNAKYYRSKELMVSHACDLAKTVENSQIKIPASKAGIEAFEELTYQGISINATVSFTVSQAIAVAEAVERGLDRRVKEGKSITTMNPVCTIMIGRVDDYLKDYVKANKLLVEPEILEWAGVAVVKNAYQIYEQRNYRTKLLIAAFRNPYHWHEFIGGKLALTIPYEWQIKYNNSNFKIESTINKVIDASVLAKLQQLPEFNKAYDESGLTETEFESYGAFIKTMNGFLNGYDELVTIIRSYLLR